MLHDHRSAVSVQLEPIVVQAPIAGLPAPRLPEPLGAPCRHGEGASARGANDNDNRSEVVLMSYRQRHAITPLLEAIREVTLIFRRAEEADPGIWRHSSPAIHLETTQWARILQEFG
jgi:hypothetical protein